MLVHIKMCLINYRRCLSRTPFILKAKKYKILSFLPPIKQTLTKLTLYYKQLETFLNLLFFLKSARFKRGKKGRKCDFKNSRKKVQLSNQHVELHAHCTNGRLCQPQVSCLEVSCGFRNALSAIHPAHGNCCPISCSAVGHSTVSLTVT